MGKSRRGTISGLLAVLLTLAGLAAAHPIHAASAIPPATRVAHDPGQARDVATPITVTVALSQQQPPLVNQPTTVALTVSATAPALGTTVDLVLPPGVALENGQQAHWTVDLTPGVPVTRTSALRVTQPGNVEIAANVLYHAGQDEDWGDTAALHFNSGLQVSSWGYQYAGNRMVARAVPQPGGQYQPLPSLGDGTTNEPTLPNGLVPPPATDRGPQGQQQVRAAAGPPVSAFGTVTIAGKMNYTDRAGTHRPLAILVELLNGANDHVAWAYTLDDGSFSFTVANPGQFKVRMWAYFRHVAMARGAIRVIGNGGGGAAFNVGQTYSAVTGLLGPVADGATANIGTWWPDDAYAQKGAWAIYTDVFRAYFFPYSAVPPGQVPGSRLPDGATVEWQADSAESTRYIRGGNILLNGVEQYGPSAVIHEYGHNVMYNLYNGNFPPHDCTSPHYVTAASGQRCGWTEGWADFWSIAVLNDPVYRWACVKPCTPASLNLETPTRGTAGWATGEQVEGRVAGALWDLIDSANDGYDRTDPGTSPLWAIWDLLYTRQDTDFPAFWASWKEKGYDNVHALATLYQNTIDYNHPFTFAALPNRAYYTDQTDPDVYYSPAYVVDPDVPATALSYTLSSLAGPCPGVTLGSDLYVALTPAPGCYGTYEITVTVSDGVYTISHAAFITLLTRTPTLTGLTPSVVFAGGPGFTLTVSGSDFIKDSVVRWGGAERPTAFISPTELRATIAAADVAAAGTVPITVDSPGPDGGVSAARDLRVVAGVRPWIDHTLVGTSSTGRSGIATFRATVADEHGLSAIQASSSGAANQWHTLLALSGDGPLDIHAGFNVTDPAFGGSGTAGTRTIYLRTLDATGTPSPVVTLAVSYAGTSPTFTDVPASAPFAAAVGELAARGVTRGYAEGTCRALRLAAPCFGPGDPVLRAQMAALIARAMGWDAENHGTPFPDAGSVDPDLWRNVGTLAFYNVARGYQDGTYDPTGEVLRAQVISFITRAMVTLGYWTMQPDDPAVYPNVPGGSGHRQDLVTFAHFAGPVPGTTSTGQALPGWDQPATRAWFAQMQWLAIQWREDPANWGAAPRP